MINFEKTNRDSSNPDEVQGLLVNSMGVPVGKLRAELSWEVPVSADRGAGRVGRWLGRSKDAANQTDVDGNVIFFQDDEDVDFAGPDHLRALRGLATHGGNVVKGDADAPEVITIDLAGIAEREKDLTAAAFTASCFTGDFSKVTGARVDFYDDTTGSREHLTTVRFKITGASVPGQAPDNAALVAVVIKLAGGWALRKNVKKYGRARDWKGLAQVARTAVTQ